MSLKDILHHQFSDPALLEEALTHPSLGGPRHYQRLEFLGDRVLGLIVSAKLYALYPGDTEGRLNRRLSSLVRKETLAELCAEIGLDQFIKVQDGPNADDLRGQPAVLADVLEAVIGALYLDGGLKAAKHFIGKYWRDRFKQESGPRKDAKSALQEWAQGRKLDPPLYQVLERKGTDHAPKFVIEASIPGYGAESAADSSKRRAEQAAARCLLAKLTDEKK